VLFFGDEDMLSIGQARRGHVANGSHSSACRVQSRLYSIERWSGREDCDAYPCVASGHQLTRVLCVKKVTARVRRFAGLSSEHR
jgi:hypothetical protein